MSENATLPAPSGHSLETRMALVEFSIVNIGETLKRIETRLDRIEIRQGSDFRILFGAIITLGLGLAGLLAHGLRWV